MFKLPSLRFFLTEAGNTFKRFPLPLVISAIATGVAIYVTHQNFREKENIENLWKIVMCCSLGLPLSIAIRLFAESRNISRLQTLLLNVAALLLLISYYFLLPDLKEFPVKEGIRFALFIIGLHLLVSFSPFIDKVQTNGFWQFNKSLFLRFLTAGLYSGVLYIGLALALLAIDELFKVRVNEHLYLDLWLILAGIFNTWFFLTGVPAQTSSLDTVTSYPKGLKIFTQFVLLPLVAVYLFILYAYGFKIAIAMELPRGWVSYLVIGFSIAGILSLLLIWPIRNEEGNSWIKIADRWFYRALYPLIILLGLAIYKRVSEYGITENRYFILLLALWLAAIATYFLISKTKNIKVIPISLCILAFLSSFGPWGAFSVSERSQLNRLEKLLTEEQILVNGKIKKSDTLLQNENSESIVSLVDYLENHHDFEGIQPWFNQNLDSLFIPEDSINGYVNKREIILELMGVDNFTTYTYEGKKPFNIMLPDEEHSNKTIAVRGYDYYIPLNGYFYEDARNSNYHPPIVIDKDTFYIKLQNNYLHLFKGTESLDKHNFIEFAKELMASGKLKYDSYTVAREQLQLQFETDSLAMEINFTIISGVTEENDSVTVNSFDSHVLIKRK